MTSVRLKIPLLAAATAALVQLSLWAWRTAVPQYPPNGLDANMMFQWPYWPAALAMALPVTVLAFALIYAYRLIRIRRKVDDGT